jgi:hypothetical protein
VTVAAAAERGTYTPPLTVSARDATSLADASKTQPLAPAVLVQAPASLVFGSFEAPAQVARYGRFEAAVSVTNTGGAGAGLEAFSLVFSQNGLTLTTAGRLPAVLDGGAGATATFTTAIRDTRRNRIGRCKSRLVPWDAQPIGFRRVSRIGPEGSALTRERPRRAGLPWAVLEPAESRYRCR